MTADPQDTRVYRQHLVDTHQCSVCGGALVELYGIVGCPRFCRPAGFIERTVAAQARHDKPETKQQESQ